MMSSNNMYNTAVKHNLDKILFAVPCRETPCARRKPKSCSHSCPLKFYSSNVAVVQVQSSLTCYLKKLRATTLLVEEKGPTRARDGDESDDTTKPHNGSPDRRESAESLWNKRARKYNVGSQVVQLTSVHRIQCMCSEFNFKFDMIIV